eukprot:TRINITY_DN13609_c0_g1_i1.p1 TRINITY_DN13609_c0_g1~~TRINITY_DN13609_c0_g1_i1.p1  ORF type:complete len:277 (+),score=77.55 TRINITY_DN13609_c0_g1_i1:22-831(+)
MSLNLLLHAIRMIANNIGEALKASVGPMAILIVALLLVAAVLGLPLGAIGEIGSMGMMDADGTMQQPTPEEMMMAGKLGLFTLIGLVLYLFVFCWIAVTWHRYILLGEDPSWITSPSGLPIGSYLWTSVKLVLLLIVVFVPVSIVLGLIIGPLMMASPWIAGGLMFLLMGGLFSFLWLRTALGLPAAAIGEKLGIRESWSKTGSFSGQILGVALLLIAMNLILGLPSLLVGANLVGALLDLIVQWFTIMVGVGILTTLYGHIVEGRPLN